MAMNLTIAQEGGFTPYIKYNAKAGRWFVKGENGDVEISNPRMAVDLENGRSGWLCFPIGSAPVAVWDDAEGRRLPKPEPIGTNSFKEGFEVVVFGPDKQPLLANEPIGLREWSSSSNAAKEAIVTMNVEYQNNKAANPGKVPVFQATGIEAKDGQYGTNYTPVMTLVEWIDRSKVPAFDELIAKVAAAPQAVPPQTSANGDWQAPDGFDQNADRVAMPAGGDAIDDEIPF